MNNIKKIIIGVLVLIIGIKFSIFAQNSDEVIIATVGNVELKFGEYCNYLGKDRREITKRKLLKNLIDIALLYQKALELNLDKGVSLKKKIDAEEDIWSKRQIIAITYMANIEDECKNYDNLIKKLIKNKVKSYYFNKTLAEIPQEMHSINDTEEIPHEINIVKESLNEEIWDEYTLNLRKEYKVEEHYSLLHVFLPDNSTDGILSFPCIILPLQFTSDFNIIQRDPLVFNLPNSEPVPYQTIEIILEVENLGKLSPYIMYSMFGGSSDDIRYDFRIKTDDIKLEIEAVDRVDDEMGKTIIICSIPNIEGISTMDIETNDIGYSGEKFKFVWNFTKENGNWKFKKNNSNKIIIYKLSDIKEGLGGMSFNMFNDNEALIKSEYGSHVWWKCGCVLRNSTSEAIFLEWPPLITADNGEEIRPSEYDKNVEGYIEAFTFIPVTGIQFNQDIPFSVKKLNFIFNIRENESIDSLSKKVRITLIRTSNRAFKVEYK